MYSELLVSSLNFMSCTSDYMYMPPTLKSVRSDVKQPEGLDLTEIRAVPVSELQIAHADPTGTTWHCRHEAATEMLGINVRMWGHPDHSRVAARNRRAKSDWAWVGSEER